MDLAATAVVAVEGLTRPPRSAAGSSRITQPFVAAEVNAETARVLRSVMLGSELQMARTAPHAVVMIDGALTLPIIYFNQESQSRERHQRSSALESSLGSA